MLEELEKEVGKFDDPEEFIDYILMNDGRVLSTQEMLALLLKKEFNEIPPFCKLRALLGFGIKPQIDGLFGAITGKKEVDIINLDEQLTEFFQGADGKKVLEKFFWGTWQKDFCHVSLSEKDRADRRECYKGTVLSGESDMALAEEDEDNWIEHHLEWEHEADIENEYRERGWE